MFDILSHQENENQRTLKFYLMTIRMAKIKKSGDSRCLQGCGERETLFHCCWDCEMVQPLEISHSENWK